MALKKTKLPVLTRLKKAVQKVSFLLSFNPSKWFISSLARSPASRRLSYRRQLSLLDCAIADDLGDHSGEDPSRALSRSVSMRSESPRKSSTSPALLITRTISSRSGISRTTSGGGASSDDDIDKRAEDFIASFYKHIQMERQISLDLRYCRKY